LTAAYRAYRARLHHRSLREEGTVVSETEFVAERTAVREIWEATL
jgi:hypothetical protein